MARLRVYRVIKSSECDLLIALGMRFDDRVTGNLGSYAQHAKVVHFEIDPSEADKNVKSDVAVVADLRDSLIAILPLIQENKHQEWLSQFKTAFQYEYKKVIEGWSGNGNSCFSIRDTRAPN